MMHLFRAWHMTGAYLMVAFITSTNLFLKKQPLTEKQGETACCHLEKENLGLGVAMVLSQAKDQQ